ncbi:MAG: hypothetical protein K6C36_01190 [Clostridia bacterium]|nr:hypothetical protein [Clostridia bacterium]
MKTLKTALSLVLCLALCAGLACAAFAADGVYGDADGNGTVEAADARLALRISVGLEVKPEDITLIDVDGEGDVTPADARLILRFCVGLDDSFPVEMGPVEPIDFEPYGDLATLRSGTMYVKATAYEGGYGDEIEFALDGSDFYMSTEAEGLALGILVLKGDLYAICWNNNTYHKVTGAEKAILSNAGLDVDELLGQIDQMTKKLSGTGYCYKVEENYADADGNVYTAIYYTTEDDGYFIRYLMTGDQLIRSEVIDSSGNVANYVVYQFVESDTSSVLTNPKNYSTKLTNVVLGLTFMMNIAEFMGVEI